MRTLGIALVNCCTEKTRHHAVLPAFLVILVYLQEFKKKRPRYHWENKINNFLVIVKVNTCWCFITNEISFNVLHVRYESNPCFILLFLEGR